MERNDRKYFVKYLVIYDPSLAARVELNYREKFSII
jgi:hypothetical protein